MTSIFKFFANILGYVLNILYMLTNNYGFAILLFTLLVSIIMIPIDIKNRKINEQSAKLAKIQDEIKKKYGNNPEKMNSELMKEMQKQRINPLSSCTGCFVSILQLLIMISVFFLIGSPLQFVKKLPQEEIDNYYAKSIETKYQEKYGENIEYNSIIEEYKKKTEAENQDSNKDKEKNKQEESNIENNEDQTKEEQSEENAEVLDENKESEQEEVSLEEKIERIQEIEKEDVKGQREMFIMQVIDDEKINMNFNFLGIDLSRTPKDTINNFKDVFTVEGLKVLIIPALYIILSFVNAGIMQKKMEKQSQSAKEEVNLNNKIESKYKQDPQEDSEKLNQEDMEEIMMSSNKAMRYVMPVLIFSITMVTPIAIALYWLLNTSFELIKNKIVDKIIEKQKEKDEKKEA